MVPVSVPTFPWRDSTTFTSYARHTNPSFPLFVLFWIVGSQTRHMVTVLTSFTLQQGLGLFVFPTTHMAKLAATTAPVLLILFRGALCLVKAKLVERLTAYLAVQHLMLSFTGTEEAHIWWHERRRGQYT